MVKYENNKINISLNVIKTFAIFAIIYIHCGLFSISNKSLLIDALCRFAVPFFFLISGFYSFFENDKKAIEKYKLRIIRLIKLFIIANLLYFVFNIITLNLNWLEYLISIFTLKAIINLIIFNQSPIVQHLWFIGALIYCYILYYILLKIKLSPKKLYILIPILLIALTLLGEMSIYHGFKIDIYVYRNFLFTGLPFFTLGYLIHEKNINISEKIIIIAFISGLILTLMESQLIGKCELFIGVIIFTIALFIWCVQFPHRLNFKILGWIGGKLYALMYILHIMVVKLFLQNNISLNYFNQYLHINWLYFNPILIFIITALISAILYYLNKNLISPLLK